MIDILQFPFFQRALLAGLLASVACGIIGVYVVVKRIASLSGGIAHSAFGGIGLSYFFNFNPLLGATIFSLLASTIMGTIRIKLKEREDILISTIWAVGMSVGIIFIFLTSGYAADLFSYLFGNILLVSTVDLALILGLDLIILCVVFFLFRSLQAITFDEEYAEIINLPTFPLYLVLLGLVSLTVVVLIRVVGVILVVALLTLPAATAEIFVKDIKKMMGLAIAFSAAANVFGLILSYYLNLPSGPLIIFASLFFYIFALVLKRRS